jgi:hypothetical protein
MIKLRQIIAIAAMAFAPAYMSAECEIHLMVAEAEQIEDIPAGADDFLTTKLVNAVTALGVSADTNYGQFIIAGKFNHITSDVVAGPPIQTAVHTMLTLYIADANTHKIFASQSFDLRGVGKNDQRAIINALSSVNARNTNFEAFVKKGKAKIISYFDANYKQILMSAKNAASRQNYDEALYYAMSIPECCQGYNEAAALVSKYYQSYIDYDGKNQLSAARAEWAKGQDREAAARAFALLVNIDPQSAAYPAAESLANEIKASIKDDRTFEIRKKYNDQVDIEKERIGAARDVGVAWGNGQKPKTTNITWLH